MPAGLPTNLNALRDMLNNGQSDVLKWSIGAGLLPGWSVVNVNGIAETGIGNLNVRVIVWDLEGIGVNYSYPTASPETWQLSSTGVGDVGTVLVTFLSSAWATTTQTVTLNGQTPVSLTSSGQRVLTLEVLDGLVAGNLYLSVNGAATTGGVPNTTGDIREYADSNFKISASSVYTVPDNTLGIITRWWGGGLRSDGSGYNTHFELWKRELLDSNGLAKSSPYFAPLDTIHTRDTSLLPDCLFILPSRTDIRITAQANAYSANAHYNAGFEMILVPNA